MRRPVLEHKMAKAVEELRQSDTSSFDYQGELWTLTKIGMTEEGEPMFVFNVEARGEWHEPR